MTEHPILFSGAMVRALLAGTKTQTRREAIKSSRPGLVVPCDFDAAEAKLELENTASGQRYWKPCPYGRPGDRLWVRENGWERPPRTPKMLREGADTWAPYYYDADGVDELEAADFKAWGFKRRPSIHMPRWACRIVLEVTEVRVQRLREITHADCRAEGCSGGHGSIAGYPYSATPYEHYTHVWTSLNGAKSWQANPWVWAVSFRRVDAQPKAAMPPIRMPLTLVDNEDAQGRLPGQPGYAGPGQ